MNQEEEKNNGFSELACLVFCSGKIAPWNSISQKIENGATFNRETDAVLLQDTLRFNDLLFQYGIKSNVNLNVIKVLLEYGANPSIPYEKNRFFLEPFSQNFTDCTDEELLDYFFKNRVHIDLPDNKRITLFHRICLADNPNLDLIALFIEYGADIHEKYEDNSLLYHLCAQTNPNLEVIEYLIEKGVNPKENKKGVGVLLQLIDPWNVCYGKCREPLSPIVLQYLIKKGANSNVKDSSRYFAFVTMFYRYSELGSYHEQYRKQIEDRFITFIEYSDLDPNALDDSSHDTIFNEIAGSVNDKHYRVIEALLKKGVRFDSINRYGDNPLHSLFSNFKDKDNKEPILSLISLFIRYGADINVKNRRFETCLDIVCSESEINTELLGHLLSQGASLQNLQRHARKLMEHSIKTSNMTLALLLIAYGDIFSLKDVANAQGNPIERVIASLQTLSDIVFTQAYIKKHLMFYKDIPRGFIHFPQTMQSPVFLWMLVLHRMKAQEKQHPLPLPPKRLGLEMASWMLLSPGEIADNIIVRRVKPEVNKALSYQKPSHSLLLRFLSHPGIKVASFLLLLLGAGAFFMGTAAIGSVILGIAASVYTTAGIATASAGTGLLLSGLFASLIKYKKEHSDGVKPESKYLPTN